jgi:hypothetical protein
MNRRDNNRIEELVRLAEQPDADAEAQLSEGDRGRIQMLRQVLESFRLGIHAAPKSLVDAAKELMPMRQRRVWARLTRTTLGLAGARAEAARQFQAEFESDAGVFRLQYSREADGWTVRGQLPGGEWSQEFQGQLTVLEGNRFSQRFDDLEQTSFTFVSDAYEVVIPALTDMVDHELGTDDPSD